ncbi:CASP-LIKE PROTEIN 4C1 [Salix purpurea]|uniref:CASP-like protein n=1 Tax=Salix purpurea TaxID=77065 RepID=A0A9Q0UBN1_SALPP|nr:CASP-LIKE PROTEIN 4C1 [Salix purpurea]
MRYPQPHRNGGETQQNFHSTVSLQKLKRFNSLILVFRFSGFCFTLASAVFMFTNYGVSDSLDWLNFDAFRYVFVANMIASVYSLFEMTAAVWEISRNATLLPEICQVWFDFSHDQVYVFVSVRICMRVLIILEMSERVLMVCVVQVFAYLLLSASSAGTEMARAMKGTCTDGTVFCVQSDIAIALGFVGFLFSGVSALLSGFRVVCFIINGSRFYV